MTKEPYQTDDIEERNVTAALSDLFASVASSGETEDPLELVCKSLVRCVEDIKFAFYCYENDETGRIAAVREGVTLYLPPPDIQRKVVANLRRVTRGGKIAVITPEKSLALLTPVQRRKWKCHRGVAVEVKTAGRVAAILAVFLEPDFKITDRHRVWLSLFRDAASARLTRRQAYVCALAERDESAKALRETTLRLESVRTHVREHLGEVAKVKNGMLTGSLSRNEGQERIEKSADTLYAVILPESGGDAASNGIMLDDSLRSWVRTGLKDPRIKAVVGIRGSGKSAILHAVRSLVLSSGVEENHVVIIDFEDARFRKFKTADDVVMYLSAFPKSKKPNYVFMDEIGHVGWHSELFRRLIEDGGWNVWVTASTMLSALPGLDQDEEPDLLVYKTWANPQMPRSRSDLARIWCQIFMRDVSCGVDNSDIRAKEVLAEYYSDHMGEVKSLREICQEIAGVGRSLSTMTIRSYRESLVAAHLIEISKVYDPIEEKAVPSASGRVFYTDLELRTWRFGSAPKNDAARLALNRFYLDLRRKYGEVYTPRTGDADFVTLQPNGKPVLWKLPDDPLSLFGEFRGGGGVRRP